MYDDKKMFSIEQSLRYDIKDTSCPAAPLFTAKDISIQQVAMDTLGKEKEWVAVVNLNTEDKNSYLQSELPYCKAREYLIGAKVEVKAYIDDSNCCDDLRDYKHCIVKPGCKEDGKLTALKDKRNNDYSKNVMLTGTQYEVISSHDDVGRRRRLLQDRSKGDCRLCLDDRYLGCYESSPGEFKHIKFWKTYGLSISLSSSVSCWIQAYLCYLCLYKVISLRWRAAHESFIVGVNPFLIRRSVYY
jgi:hypothetical protein